MAKVEPTQLELPWPPSVNHYYRRVGARTLISRAGRAFRHDVCRMLAARRQPPINGPLAMTVELYPPDRRRRDTDNTMKSLLDALQHGGVFFDDSQIIWLLIYQVQVAPGGRVVVTIRPLCDGWQPPRAADIWKPSLN